MMPSSNQQANQNKNAKITITTMNQIKQVSHLKNMHSASVEIII